MLRTPLLLGLVVGFVLSFSPASAQSLSTADVAAQWQRLSPDQQEMVDLMARDFFRNNLTPEQQLRIAEVVSRSYREADVKEREIMRHQRRQVWQNSVRHGETGLPAFDHLTEAQKAPFRLHVMRQLDMLHIGRPDYTASRRNPV